MNYKYIDITRLLQIANRPETFFNLFPHIDFKKKGKGYRGRKRSSLSIYQKNGKWLLKNFSAKHDDIPSGDVWSVVKSWYRLDTNNKEGFDQCCKIIADASNQILPILENLSIEKKPLLKSAFKEIEKIEFIPNDNGEFNRSSSYKFAKWDSRVGKATLEYWSRLGVSIDTLKAYNIHPLRSVGYLKFDDVDFAFAYMPSDETKTIKYKRPNAPNKSQKERYIQSSGNYIFGYEQLPQKGKTLIISAGEKDTICLNHHFKDQDVHAICFFGERANLNGDFVAKLKERFDNVYCLYDNDETGERMMSKNARDYLIQPIRLSDYEIDVNDVSDVIEEHGVDKLRNIINSTKPRKLRCSDLMKGVTPSGKMVISPTGSGKTYYVASLDGKKVIVCPTIKLVKNVVAEYGAVEYRRKEKERKYFSGIKNVKELPDLIATTYASFESLCEYLEPYKNEVRVFMDEAHNFTSATSPSFQLKQLSAVLSQLQTFEHVTLLTGTFLPNFHPYIQDLERLEITLPKPVKNLRIIDAVDTIRSAAEKVEQSINEGRFPIVLFDNKSGGLATLQSYLSGIEGMRYFNSDKKEDFDFEQLAKTGQIRSDIKGIVTTSVIKEGNNIYNPYSFDIIILGTFHSSSIEQIANRPRNPEDVTIHIVKSAAREQSVKEFSSQRYAYALSKQSQGLCDELNTDDTLDGELYAYKMMRTMPITQSDHKHRIDHLHLSNMVYESETLAEYKNDELLISNLGKYGIQLTENIESDIEATEDEKESAKESAARARELELLDYEKSVKGLFAQSDLMDIVDHELEYNHHKHTKGQKKALKRIKKLHEDGVAEHKIYDVLIESGISNAKFNRLRKQLFFYKLRNNQEYMDSNRLLIIFIKMLEKEFTRKDGLVVSADELKDKAFKCLSILENVLDVKYFEGKRNTRLIKLLRLFYDVEAVTIGGRDARTKAYQIVNLSFDDYYRNQSQTKVHNSIETTEFGVQIL